jgi:hypothetical protein
MVDFRLIGSQSELQTLAGLLNVLELFFRRRGCVSGSIEVGCLSVPTELASGAGCSWMLAGFLSASAFLRRSALIDTEMIQDWKHLGACTNDEGALCLSLLFVRNSILLCRRQCGVHFVSIESLHSRLGLVSRSLFQYFTQNSNAENP